GTRAPLRRAAAYGRGRTPPPPASDARERWSGHERRRTSESSPAAIRNRPLGEGVSPGTRKSSVRPLGLSSRPGRWTSPHPSLQTDPPRLPAVPALAPAAPPPARPAPSAERLITADSIRAHVRFLASDLLEGRGPGTRGDALAQAYIAAQLEAL